MPFFQNSTAKIVPKQTTFTYSKKTPKQIVEERETKKINELFSQINKDRKPISNNIANNNILNNNIANNNPINNKFFKNKLK